MEGRNRREMAELWKESEGSVQPVRYCNVHPERGIETGNNVSFAANSYLTSAPQFTTATRNPAVAVVVRICVKLVLIAGQFDRIV